MTATAPGHALFPRLRRPPWLAVAGDVTLVLLAAVATDRDVLARGLLPEQGPSIAIALVASAALLWRRRAPIPVALVTLVAWCVDSAYGPLLVGLYTLAAARGNDRWVWGVAGVAIVGSAAGLVHDGVAVAVLALLTGLYVNARRALVQQLFDRAQRLEREHDLVDARARADERTTIAREMHDVVAHRVSLIVLQAGALEMTVGRDPASAVEAARTIRTTGRQALDELREIVGVLRTADDGGRPPLAPQPTLDDLEALLAGWRDTGAELELRVAGDPRELSPAIERTAYRLVQEALTNAHKHAPGAAAEVRLEYARAGFEVAVVNQPPPERPSDDGRDELAASGGGHGLVGLRERVSLAGGELVAEPTLSGGFRLIARLPA